MEREVARDLVGSEEMSRKMEKMRKRFGLSWLPRRAALCLGNKQQTAPLPFIKHKVVETTVIS